MNKMLLAVIAMCLVSLPSNARPYYSQAAREKNQETSFKWMNWLTHEIERLSLPSEYRWYCMAATEEVERHLYEHLETSVETDGTLVVSSPSISEYAYNLLDATNRASAQAKLLCLLDVKRKLEQR
jgi:hypothetical protein